MHQVLSDVEKMAAKMAAVLKKDGLVIAPTDTQLGLLARFNSYKALEAVYDVKGRSAEKKLIALVSSREMAVALSKGQLPAFVYDFWPGPLTIIVSSKADHPWGWESQAIRFPDYSLLQRTIELLGEPVFAPSANPQGQPPAENIQQAREYFGNKIDLYVSIKKTPAAQASTIVDIRQNPPEILRQGGLELPEDLFNSRKV